MALISSAGSKLAKLLLNMINILQGKFVEKRLTICRERERERERDKVKLMKAFKKIEKIQEKVLFVLPCPSFGHSFYWEKRSLDK